MTHQGRLVDSLGTPVNGTFDLVFTLHTQQADGPGAAWTETDSVTVVDGYYTAVLGDQASMSALDFVSTDYWLQVAVLNGSTFLPRTPMGAVPMAVSLAGGFRPTPVTTAERDALSVSPGTMIYNTSLSRVQVYDGDSWSAVGGSGTTEGVTGTALGWGYNGVGELGLADAIRRPAATELPDVGSPVAQISGGGYYQDSHGATCFVTEAGGLYCAGRGAHVPQGTLSNRNTFYEYTGSQTWREVTVGDGLVTCGLTTDNDAYCWGLEYYGGIGQGAHGGGYTQTPSLVVGGQDWLSLKPGGRYANPYHVAVLCGVTTQTGQDNGYCWGLDQYQMLGNGPGITHDYTGPNASTRLTGFEWKSITPGYLHVCGIDINDDAYCWGYNPYGAIGDGTATTRDVPTLVSGGHKWQELSLGHYSTCGLRTDGVAMCWGYNAYGQLGNGTTSTFNTPQMVAGGKRWSHITSGDLHSCAIDSDDRAYCWGYNGNSQLGEGTTTQHNIPNPVFGEYAYEAIDAGVRHTVGIAR